MWFTLKSYFHLILWELGVQTKFNSGFFRDEDGKVKVRYVINPLILGLWQCSACGTLSEHRLMNTAEWRWNGESWEHQCIRGMYGWSLATRQVGLCSDDESKGD
jgi:hypothetical protein